MNRIIAAAVLFSVLSACQRTPQGGQSNEQNAITPQAPPAQSNSSVAAQLREPGNSAALDSDRTPLSEPSGTIDPKSVEAAGQVVQHYGALIEQNRLDEAAKLWSNAEAAAAFHKDLNPGTHVEIGNLGQTEGAAGSIYTTVPVVLYGDTFREPADIILRRVNDVPGSTEAQRRWHIERIELKKSS